MLELRILMPNQYIYRICTRLDVKNEAARVIMWWRWNLGSAPQALSRWIELSSHTHPAIRIDSQESFYNTTRYLLETLGQTHRDLNGLQNERFPQHMTLVSPILHGLLLINLPHFNPKCKYEFKVATLVENGWDLMKLWGGCHATCQPTFTT